jgi:mono/diheme cytochrome c family protein
MSNRVPAKKSKVIPLLALAAIVLAAVVALAYGVNNWLEQRRTSKMPNPVPSTEENLKAGAKVYSDHCVQCHGTKGDGKGQKAAELSVEPGNFTDVRKMQGFTDGDFFWRISKGRNPMPGYEDKLVPEQRWQVIDYVRAFARGGNAASAADRKQPAAPGRP